MGSSHGRMILNKSLHNPKETIKGRSIVHRYC